MEEDSINPWHGLLPELRGEVKRWLSDDDLHVLAVVCRVEWAGRDRTRAPPSPWAPAITLFSHTPDEEAAVQERLGRPIWARWTMPSQSVSFWPRDRLWRVDILHEGRGVVLVGNHWHAARAESHQVIILRPESLRGRERDRLGIEPIARAVEPSALITWRPDMTGTPSSPSCEVLFGSD